MSFYCHPLEARRLLSLTTVGSETTLSKAGIDSELAVAGNGTFIVANLVVNEAQDAADLVAQRYAADGSPVASQLTLDSLPWVNGGFLADLSVDMDADGDAVVVYYHSTWGDVADPADKGDFVNFVRISKTGVVSSPTLVAESDDLQVDGAAVSMDDAGGFFVGWTKNIGLLNSTVFFRAFDAAGAPRGEAFVAAHHEAEDPNTEIPTPAELTYSNLDIAAKPDGSSAAFSFSEISISSSGPQQIRYGRIDSTHLISDGLGKADAGQFDRTSQIAMNADGSFIIAWIESHRFVGQAYRSFFKLYDPQGNAITSRTEVVPASATKEVKAISLDTLPDGGFVVGYHLTDYEASGLQRHSFSARRFNANGTLNAETTVATGLPQDDAAVLTAVIAADDNGNAVMLYESSASLTDPSILKFRRLTTDAAEFASVSNGVLTVFGTNGIDTITINVSGINSIVATRGITSRSFDANIVNVIDVSGLGGDDTITNNTPLRATLRGDAGNDTIFGGTGEDRIHGGVGSDSLWGGDSADKIFGEDGNDSCYGNGGNDRIEGGAQGDHIRGNGGRDRLYGNGGNDRLYGGASGDFIYGQAGFDQILGEGGNDRLYGDDGFADTLRGGVGDDVFITLDSVSDELFGDGGHDSYIGDDADGRTSVET